MNDFHFQITPRLDGVQMPPFDVMIPTHRWLDPLLWEIRSQHQLEVLKLRHEIERLTPVVRPKPRRWWRRG